MNELNKLRDKIDIIDKEMAWLFEKRMCLIDQIALVKKKENLQINDSLREEKMFENNKQYINNKKFVKYYKMFLKSNTYISKFYMKNKLNINNKFTKSFVNLLTLMFLYTILFKTSESLVRGI